MLENSKAIFAKMQGTKMLGKLDRKIVALEDRISSVKKELEEFETRHGKPDTYGASVALVDLRSELSAKSDELKELIAMKD